MDALAYYATKAGCTEIKTGESSEFFRIWCFCITFGGAVAVLFTVPLYWCVPPGKEDDRFADPDFDGAVPNGSERQAKVQSELAEAEANKAVRGAWNPDASERNEDPPGDDEHPLPTAETSPVPDLAAARQFLRASSPTNPDGSWRGLWSTSVDDIGTIGGIGMEMYFRLLQGLGLCFCYMGVCTSPLLMFSFNGNFVPDTGSALAKTTVGNVGMIAPAGTAQEDRFIILGCQGIDVKEYTAIFGYLDAFAILLFMIYIVNFRFRTLPAQVHENAHEQVTVADFSIMIDQLPENIADQPSYEEALGMHVLKVLNDVRAKSKNAGELPPAKLCEVSLVRDYGKRLGSIKTRAELIRQAEICEYTGDTKRADKLKAKSDKLSEKLAETLAPEDTLPVVRAYVVLNCPSDVQAMLVHYRFANVALFRCLQSQSKRFEGHAIRVRPAPEPTNIIPENQDVPFSERVLRRGLMFVLWVLAVSLSASLIYLIGRESAQESGAAGSQLGSATCDKGTSAPKSVYRCQQQVAALWNTTYARAKLSGDALGCFCQTQGYEDVLSKAELRDDLCRSWLEESAELYALTIAASLVTVIVNSVFRMIISMLAAWERPLSVSSLNKSLMYKTFASQFVNTALIIHLLNYKGFGIFNGDYEGFERGWYAVVGGAMVSTLLLNSFVGALVYLATEWSLRLRRCCCRSRQKHQAELLKLYTNQPFDISSRYAQLLTTVFCTLVYSPGLPLANYLASFYCFFNFWSDKWLLLKASSRPPLYDASMPRTASRMLFWAAPLHFLAGIGMYSHACTFPSNPVGGRLAKLSSSADLESVDSTGSWSDRMTRESTWILSLFLLLSVIVVALWLLFLIFGATCGQALTACLYACCPGRAASRSSENDAASGLTWDEAQPGIESRTPPASFALDRHPEFSHLVKYLRAEANDGEAAP